MDLSKTNARITALRRYISLLEESAKRLTWILASTTASQPERADAERDVSAIAAKIKKAERELSNLEHKKA